MTASSWDAMSKTIADVFDVPQHMIVTGADDHLLPFGEVTWGRLEKGIWYHVRDLRLSGQTRAFDRLPDGWLLMHPADRMDLTLSEPTDRLRFSTLNWMDEPYGYQLVTTRDPARVRRGRPVLHLNDGTDVLL